MCSITTLFAFSPGRLPKKDKTLLRKRQNGLNVYPWVGHQAETHTGRACWTWLLSLEHHWPRWPAEPTQVQPDSCSREAEMEQIDSSPQLSIQHWPSPFKAASTEELSKSIARWSFPTRFGLRTPCAQMQDSSHSQALTAWEMWTAGNSSSSLWHSNKTSKGNASHILEIQSQLGWLQKDLINFQSENGTGEIKVNPSRFHRKAK